MSQNDANNPSILILIIFQLGVVYLEQGKKVEAFQQFEIALQHNPNHKQTLFNSAVLRQEIGDPKLRPEAYRRLVEITNNTKIDG